MSERTHEIYVITKQGVYRHEIIGIFHDLDDALGATYEAMLAEPDDYHAFDISYAPLNKRIGDVELAVRFQREGDDFIFHWIPDDD